MSKTCQSPIETLTINGVDYIRADSYSSGDGGGFGGRNA